MFALFSIVCDSRIHRRSYGHHHHSRPTKETDQEFAVSNGNGDTIASKAISKIGCKYVYGAAGPNTFDCSGLSQWCHKQVGISIPRTASAQAMLFGSTSEVALHMSVS